MYTDKLGDRRYKVALHLHTTISDGLATPEQAARTYLDAGFDAIAITDHWKYHTEDNIGGLKIIAGCEYNLGGRDTMADVMHIVGLGMTYDPGLERYKCGRQEVIDRIRAAGGIAVLAHPCWSLNRPEEALELEGISATEIYNSVSAVHESFRPYSGYFVDVLANLGRSYPLVAADDAHFYDGDAGRSYIMVRAADNSTGSILDAICRGDFYATQGPELLVRRFGRHIIVDCSPADDIIFVSNASWIRNRAFRDSGRTHAEYIVQPCERWIRVELRSGNDFAWSNIIWM